MLAENTGKRTGLIFGHDQMACAAWNYCIKKGIRVPQDIGLVGRGNVLTYMMPLTTTAGTMKRWPSRWSPF